MAGGPRFLATYRGSTFDLVLSPRLMPFCPPRGMQRSSEVQFVGQRSERVPRRHGLSAGCAHPQPPGVPEVRGSDGRRDSSLPRKYFLFVAAPRLEMTASSNFFHRGAQFLIHLNALLLAHFLQGFRVPIAFPRLLATRPSYRHIAASEPASHHFLRKRPRHRTWLQAPKT